MGSLTAHPLKERPPEVAPLPALCDVGHEAPCSAPKGATPRLLEPDLPGWLAVLSARCVPFSSSPRAHERRRFRPVKASETFCGSVAYTDPQKVLRASKEPKAMRFAVQPNG